MQSLTTFLHRATVTLAIALIALCLLWESQLAPLRQGGSWLILKALPIVPFIPGLVRAERRAFQWLTLIVWFHFVEGVVRAWSEKPPAQTLALIEVVLALALIASAAAYARVTRSH